MSNSLDQDHARHSAGPDLDPSCLQGENLLVAGLEMKKI